MLNEEREQRKRKCREVLSASICNNNNPQPFYLWAQVAARDLTEDPLQSFKGRMLAKLAA